MQVETEPGPQGVAITFVVREKPFITEIVFDGNEDLSDDKLKEKVTIKSQTFLDQQQAKESADRIRLAYQEDGFFNCQVVPVIQTVDEDRKRLTFFIKEGTKAKVRSVNFEGMRAATKEEMFKVMATRDIQIHAAEEGFVARGLVGFQLFLGQTFVHEDIDLLGGSRSISSRGRRESEGGQSHRSRYEQ